MKYYLGIFALMSIVSAKADNLSCETLRKGNGTTTIFVASEGNYLDKMEESTAANDDPFVILSACQKSLQSEACLSYETISLSKNEFTEPYTNTLYARAEYVTTWKKLGRAFASYDRKDDCRAAEAVRAMKNAKKATFQANSSGYLPNFSFKNGACFRNDIQN